DAAGVKAKLTAREALIAPYGSYWHDPGFFRTQVRSDIQQKCVDALKKSSSTMTAAQALAVLLPQSNQPNFTPNLLAIDPTWKEGEMPSPTAQTVAKDFREWMCTDWADSLMKRVTNAAGSMETNLTKLLALAKETKFIPELKLKAGKRPEGVLGDYRGQPASAAPELPKKAEYKSGFFPPKYREWDQVVTRRYPDMQTYLNAETKNNVLELRGAVLIERMNHTQGFTYHGRGIIICGSEQNAPAVLTGVVGPSDADSLLVLVHRVSGSLLKNDKPPQIQLVPQFKGSVYSDSGVKPTGLTQIYGNLVCGLIAKGATLGSDTLSIEYKTEEKRLACPKDKMHERWTVEMSGEVSSTQPAP
ncbi:MAG: hypothetical protein AAB295_09180, partial [Chloroflexota bacterium]